MDSQRERSIRGRIAALATVAVGVTAVAPAAAAAPELKVRATGSHDGGSASIVVQTAASARCTVQGPAGGGKPASGSIGKKGNRSFRLTLPTGSGDHRYRVACKKGRARGGAKVSVTVEPPTPQAPEIRPPEIVPPLDSPAVNPPKQDQPNAEPPQADPPKQDPAETDPMPEVDTSSQSSGEIAEEQEAGPEPEPGVEGYGAGAPYVDGQCTRYAWYQRQDLPANLGNAHTWDERAASQGFPIDRSPRAGDVAVWEAWTNGARGVGHVAYVESVNHNGTITISEWNWKGPFIRTVRVISPAGLKFIHRKGSPPAVDMRPHISNIRVFSSPTLAVRAGGAVNAEVVVRYDGPVAVPCAHARLGNVGDVDIPFADRRRPDFPNGTWWLTGHRVIPHGCNGELRPGQEAHYTVSFYVPPDAVPGVRRVARFSFVHEGRAWAPEQFDVNLDIKPGMAARFEGQEATEKVVAGDTGRMMVALRNDSTMPWRRGAVNLGVRGDERFVFADDSWPSGNRMFLREQEVAVGEVGHFEATYVVPKGTSPGCRRVRLAPVFENRYWFGEDMGIYLDACVAEDPEYPAPPAGTPGWSAKYLGQETPPMVEAGTTGRFVFKVRNTGARTWDSHVHLGTARPQDAAVRWAGQGVVGSNRVNFTDASGDGRVVYGEEARFEYEIAPPADAAGSYRQYWALVNDNGGPWFFGDAGMYAPVVVASQSRWSGASASECTWKLEHQDAPVTVHVNRPARFKWILRNTSETCPWYREGAHPFRLGTDRPRDGASPFYVPSQGRQDGWLVSNRLEQKEAVVPPGGTATFEFEIRRPPGMASTDDARLYATPVLDGLGWLDSIGMYAPIKVTNLVID